MSDPADPFDTAVLRAAVLESWAASPARFREDANAEEDLVRGGYRDRWLVELAQNAADAAARAGRRTRLSVSAVVSGSGDEIRVAGAGEPLTAAGVSALASLRASAQRDRQGPGESVGRFGVGFAAVTAVSDAPRVVSTSGAVAFDRARTTAAVAQVAATRSPELAEELARRDGAVPVLRLVWPAVELVGIDETPALPSGASSGTEVRLPLRPGLDAADLLDDARAQAPDLLLALPWLDGIDVLDASGGPDASFTRSEARQAGSGGTQSGHTGSGHTVTVSGPSDVRAWRVLRASGPLPPDPDLAVEDRSRRTWEILWAAPMDDRVAGTSAPDVLLAPTPTDERTTLPARLVATVPLDPDRRHVRPGATTDHVLAAAAARYPDLVRATPPEDRIALVPTPGLPASAVDATLRDAVVEALRTTAWLPAADDAAADDAAVDNPASGDLVPARATVLDPELDTPGLASHIEGAVAGLAATPASSRDLSTLASLGVTPLDAAGLAEALAGVTRPPPWWGTLYALLAPAAASSRVRDELAALPVPLADGRMVLGPRGALLTRDGDEPDGRLTAALAALDVPGLRVVHPAAAHPLLVGLGATEAGADALLGNAALCDAVERSVDDADAGLDVDPLASLVLSLVARGGGSVPGRTDADAPETTLGALALPDAHGERRRADELVLPDGALRALVDPVGPLGVLDAGVADAHPRAALTTVGVLDGFAILYDQQPTGPDHDLDDEEAWWSEEVDPEDASDSPDASGTGDAGPLVAVRDLDLIADGRWPAAWRVLAGDRAVRDALGTDALGPRALGAASAPRRAYTAWWLARHGLLAGRLPVAWRLADADADLVGLYDPVPPEEMVGLDTAFLVAVGVRDRLVVRDTADAADLLGRLADPARTVDPAAGAAAHAALVAAVAAGRVALGDVEPPDRVRTADGAVRDADPDPSRAAAPVVLDHPWLLSVVGADVAVLPGGGGDPRTLADLLDLALAADRLEGLIRSTGVRTAWRRIPDAVAWAGTAGVALPTGGDAEILVHERLHVLVTDVERGGPPVQHTPHVWREPDGTLHTDDPVRALIGLTARPARRT